MDIDHNSHPHFLKFFYKGFALILETNKRKYSKDSSGNERGRIGSGIGIVRLSFLGGPAG